MSRIFFRPYRKFPLLGLVGKAGSGKSTAAKHLVETYSAICLSLATPLKLMAKAIWEFTDEQLYGSTQIKEAVDSRWNMSPRTALQRLGTDAIRKHLGDDVWIRALIKTLDERVDYAQPQLFVVDDVRFRNEANFIGMFDWKDDERIEHNHKGYLVKLICEDSDSSYRGTHPSESEIDQIPETAFDRIIVSHKSPGSVHLKQCIDSFMNGVIVPEWENRRE